MQLHCQPDLFERGGSINRRGFARRSAIPGLRGKCAYGRSRNAGTPIGIRRVERCVRIGGRRNVPRGDAALAGHGGSCEGGCGDQCSRQKLKLGHSISPLDVKSQQRSASLWKWSSDRPIKVTIPHLASTQREIGASRQFGSLNRFLIENVSVGDHCQSDLPALVRLPEVRWGDPPKKTPRKLEGVGAAKSAHAAADYIRRQRWFCSRALLSANA
jgi:hypothetical protein